MSQQQQGKLSVWISNSDTPVGYELARHCLMGKYSHLFSTVVCTVKNVDFSGALLTLGAIVVEMKDQNVPEWLPNHLKALNVQVCLLVPDVASSQTRQQGKNIIDCCKNAELGHIVLLSLMGIEGSDLKKPMDFLQLEDHLKKSGLREWCIVRHAMLQQRIFLQANDIKQKKRLAWPIKEDAKCAFVNIHDVCDFIIQGVTQQSKNFGQKQIYRLTGPEALTGKQITEKLSQVVNQQLRFDYISRDEAKRNLEQLLLNEEHIQFHLDVFELISRGKMAMVSDDQKKGIGKEPERIDKFFKEHANRFESLKR